MTGDNVSAMAFCDVDGDGQLELLVGSEDYEIRVFRNEEVRPETSRTRTRTRTRTTHLSPSPYP